MGTVFIDGSAMIGSSRANGATFTGKGALFLTGTFLMKNSLMCVRGRGSGPTKLRHGFTDTWIRMTQP